MRKPSRTGNIHWPMTELAVIVCDHVFRDERPVLLAMRDDELVCLLCGADDHADSAADSYRVVGANHLLERDPSIELALQLGVGEEVERAAVGEAWA